MSRDIFDDRLGFAAARHAFVMKRPAGRRRAPGAASSPSASSPEDRSHRGTGRPQPAGLLPILVRAATRSTTVCS